MSTPFIRDRFTWLGYFSLAYYAYLQATLGPLMPFLRKELDLSYTVGGLHFSAFALGMVLAGISADRVARRYGRWLTFWGGGTGIALGSLFFIISPHVLLTVPSVFLMGFIGTYLLVMIQSTLSDHHQHHRAIPLTESNIAASAAATMAPLLVGSFQRIDIGWRAALVVGIACWALLYWFYGSVTIPASQHNVRKTSEISRRLPLRFWVFWLVIFFAVSVEWSVIFWGADFLETDIGLSRVNAATLMSVFFVAMLVGRITGSWLTRFISLPHLLLGAVGLATTGFTLYWVIDQQILSILGLFLTGLGVANLFPLTLSLASGTVTSDQSDQASGRVSLGAGAAILIAPQILGAIADQTSIRTAYGMVMVLLVIVLGVVLVANRLSPQAALQPSE